MRVKPKVVQRFLAQSFLALICVLTGAIVSSGQSGTPTPASAIPDQAQALVERALAAELQAAQDTSHPMRYVLHKESPRLSTTKEIIETKDGAVARLTSINEKPLSSDDEHNEHERLDALLGDPGRQRHRKQSEDDDSQRAIKVLRVLPNAFLYQFAGASDGPNGPMYKFSFHPNPKFTPPDLETQVLTAMSGEIMIDATQQRVTRLEGHLEDDVDFGWGILGRLNKGGWIVLEQADVADGQWRIVRFQMVMSGRVIFRTRSFDTTQEQSRFTPVPAGLGYREAIQMLRSNH